MPPEATQPTFDEVKFRELVLYIVGRCASLPRFGLTKLYKVLFYADFEAYRRRKKPIGGARYLAREWGPVPDSYERSLVESRMVEDGQLALKLVGGEQRYTALRDPNYELFTAEEIDIASSAIDKLKDASARTASTSSHPVLAWRAAHAERQATGKEVIIPYSAVFVSSPVLDEFEEEHALALARKHHWRTTQKKTE